MSSTVRERRRVPAQEDIALFHRTLAELCRSEVPLSRALRVLATDLRSATLREAVLAMAKDVDDGMPLAEAYAARAAGFPPLYRALVEAGVAAGDLPAVLEQIAEHARQKGEIAAKLRRALAYPTLAAGFVVVTGAALLVFVAPRVVELNEAVASANGESWAPDLGARWTALFVWLVLVGLVAASAAVFVRFRGPIDGTVSGRALRYRIPILGRLRHDAELATIAATLALLLRRRMALPRALDLVAEVTESTPLRRVALAAADAAHEGHGVASAVREAGLFAPSLLWILEAAEKRGEAEGALADLAQIHRARLARSVDRAALIVTPVAEVIVGFAVFLLAYSFLAPLMDLTRRIFRA